MPTSIVIDDDLDVCQALAEYLEYAGLYVLGVAHNGKDGVELFQNTNPDVVFLDWMMPKYDGLYALENIRKTGQGTHIIILTATPPQEIVSRLHHHKPDRIIGKPFGIDEIRDSVVQIKKENLIGRHPEPNLLQRRIVIADQKAGNERIASYHH